MSSDIVIQVKGLSKCYHIYDHPRDRLKQFIYPRARAVLGKKSRGYFREFWALHDVSFKVRKGETVGILGKNGSGKSTLLQIVCGTLSQTSGDVFTQGRVAALLELGSGFNPEFTGRENVFLNGAVLGFTKEEIEEKFEEITSFADIGQFIDQPVKTYSSGMLVRLAFAVQACVDPQILIVDEALAVGDIGFQYKCFKRMEQLKERGVTILMVTHSSASVLEYADRCLVLDGGRLVEDSRDVLAAVLAYEKGMLGLREESKVGECEPDTNSALPSLEELRAMQISSRSANLNEKRFGSARAIVRDLKVFKSTSGPATGVPVFNSQDELVFRFEIISTEAIRDVVLGVSVSRAQGADIWGDNNLFAGEAISLTPGRQIVEYKTRLSLASGEYLVHCGLATFENAGQREELDQRRPLSKISYLNSREQVGIVYAPIKVSGPTSGYQGDIDPPINQKVL